MKTLLRQLMHTMLVSIIACGQYGCGIGLTSRLWSHSEMEKERTERIEKYHVSSENNSKIYLKWISHDRKERIIEIDLSNISEQAKHALLRELEMRKRHVGAYPLITVNDYSSVPRSSRKYYPSGTGVMPFELFITPKERDVTKYDDICIDSIFLNVKANVLDKLPQDAVIASNQYFQHATLDIYKANGASPLGNAAKIAATPFTSAADVILIPVGTIVLVVMLSLSPNWP